MKPIISFFAISLILCFFACSSSENIDSTNLISTVHFRLLEKPLKYEIPDTSVFNKVNNLVVIPGDNPYNLKYTWNKDTIELFLLVSSYSQEFSPACVSKNDTLQVSLKSGIPLKKGNSEGYSYIYIFAMKIVPEKNKTLNESGDNKKYIISLVDNNS